MALMQFVYFVILIVLFSSGAIGSSDDVIAHRDDVADWACSADRRPYVFTEYNASFASPGRPNLPEYYPDNSNCQWLIIGQEPRGFVSLDFSLLSTEAAYDFVVIYDGNSTSSPILTSFDGAWSPAPKKLMSSQSSMLIVFTSDYTRVDLGFVASYTSVPLYDVKDPCFPLSRPLLVTDGAGELTSPYFSDYYLNYADCQWLIESQVPGGIVTLDFTNFFTENLVDTVYLYDGPTASSRQIASLNGVQTTTGWRTTQTYMFVRFTTNSRAVRTGWRANYSSQPAP